MDRRGVKRRRVHRSYCPRPIRTRRRHPLPALPTRPVRLGYVAAVSPWGKNPARRGACGIFPPGQNFQRPGGGVQGTPRAQA